MISVFGLAIWRVGRRYGNYAETGFAEITSDAPEADFQPNVVGVRVMCISSRA
jgi:hypothetical protein